MPKNNNAYVDRNKNLYLDSYLKNKLNGNFHLSRANAILEQLERKEFGVWNGVLYTKECLESEYWLAKHSAIKSFAGVQVCLVELSKLGIMKNEAEAYLEKFLNSKIQLEDYSDFIDETDDKTAGFKEE